MMSTTGLKDFIHIKFRKTPPERQNPHQCVPRSWIKCVFKNNSVVIAYPTTLGDEEINEHIKSNKPPLSHWPALAATIEYTSDSYEDARKRMMISIVASHVAQRRNAESSNTVVEDAKSLKQSPNSQKDTESHLHTDNSLLKRKLSTNTEKAKQAKITNNCSTVTSSQNNAIKMEKREINHSNITRSQTKVNYDELIRELSDKFIKIRDESIAALALLSEFTNPNATNRESSPRNELKDSGKDDSDDDSRSTDSYSESDAERDSAKRKRRKSVSKKSSSNGSSKKSSPLDKLNDSDIDNDSENSGTENKTTIEENSETKWTLKHPAAEPGLTELLPGSNVFIKEKYLKKCTELSKDAREMTRMLLSGIFSEKALKYCSMCGSKCGMAAKNEFIRPGLDDNARNTLISFVKICVVDYGLDPVNDIDIKRVIQARLQALRSSL